MKYPTGTELICGSICGVVVDNYKLPMDVCVDWETGEKSSYDVEWLDEFTKIIKVPLSPPEVLK